MPCLLSLSRCWFWNFVRRRSPHSRRSCCSGRHGSAMPFSYLFIAIVWINHHHLLRYTSEVTLRLTWFNFAHLFSVSLLPLSTAWIAASELAPEPVAFYAAVSFSVNATYILLLWNVLGSRARADISPAVGRTLRVRAVATLCLFGLAAIVTLVQPLVGLGICCLCPILYLNPHVPGASWPFRASSRATSLFPSRRQSS